MFDRRSNEGTRKHRQADAGPDVGELLWKRQQSGNPCPRVPRVETVGPWTLGEELGRGGMGAVHRAHRGSDVVALKIIHPVLAADADFRKRFRREAALARRIVSPRVAQLIDEDVEASPAWIATELVEGPNLAEKVAGHGPLTAHELDRLAVGMAEALVALEQAHVVHRDIKPSNVLLSQRGPVLVDFGVAHSGDSTQVTRVGQLVGSNGWMAPEQETTGEVTPASDVFAWGLLVAFAATGEHPLKTGAVDLTLVPPRWQPVVGAALARAPALRPDAPTLLAWSSDPSSAPTHVLPQESPTRVELGAPALVEAARRGGGLRRVLVPLAGLLVIAAVGGLWWILFSGDDRLRDEATQRAGQGGSRLPLVSAEVDLAQQSSLHELDATLRKHVQEDVRLDVNFVADEISDDGQGSVTLTLGCFPICASRGLQAVNLNIDNLDRAADVSFGGAGSTWGVAGRFRVTSISTETGGVLHIVLRPLTVEPAATPSEVPTPNATPSVAGAAGPDVVVDSPRRCSDWPLPMWDEMLPAPEAPLAVGRDNSVPHVLLAQRLLNTYPDHYPEVWCSPENGVFDASTQISVRSFQSAFGLEVDGVIGPATWSRLMLYFE